MLVVTDSAVFEVDETGARPSVAVYEGDSIRCAASAGSWTLIGHSDGDVAALGPDSACVMRGRVPDAVASLVCVGVDPLSALVGTDDGAHMYRLDADGSAELLTAFDELPCRDGWHTPWGGPPAVRSLAQTGDGWVYADVHVGSIMRSPDRGTSWEPVSPELHEDVHQVATCPADDTLVCANTAEAVYVSEDRGTSWTRRASGLAARYGRAIAVHPDDPGRLLATVSDGPHAGNGRLYRSSDCGRSRTQAVDGFPETTEGNIDTGHVAFTSAGEAWCAVGRTVYGGGDLADEWHTFWEAP